MFCFFVLFCFLCRSSLLNSHNLPAASSDHLRRSSSSAFFSFLSLSHPCWVKAYSWCWFFFFFYPFFKKFVSLCCDRFKKYKQAGSHSTSFRLTNGRTDDTGVCVRERDPFHMSGFQLGSMEILINWKYRSELLFFFLLLRSVLDFEKTLKSLQSPVIGCCFYLFLF